MAGEEVRYVGLTTAEWEAALGALKWWNVAHHEPEAPFDAIRRQLTQPDGTGEDRQGTEKPDTGSESSIGQKIAW